MSVFGLPFFAAGVFLVLTVVGVVPVSNADELPALAWPVLVLMAIAFTAVGGALVFGRSWTTIDRAQREVSKQWGLIVPLKERVFSLDGYNAIRLDFVQGDSDTADQFPIALKARTAPDLRTVQLHRLRAGPGVRQGRRGVPAGGGRGCHDGSSSAAVGHSDRRPASVSSRGVKTGCSPKSIVRRAPGARSPERWARSPIVIPTRPLQGLSARAGARGGNHSDHDRADHRAFAREVLPRHPDSGSGCLGVSRIPDAVLRCRPDDDDRQRVPALAAGRDDRRGVETGAPHF